MLKLKFIISALILFEILAYLPSANASELWNLNSETKKDVYVYYVGISQSWYKPSGKKECQKNPVHLVISPPVAIPYLKSVKVDSEAIKKELGVGKAHRVFEDDCDRSKYSFHWSHASFHDTLQSASQYQNATSNKAIGLFLQGAVTAIANAYASKKTLSASDLAPVPLRSLVNFGAGVADVNTTVSLADFIDGLSAVIRDSDAIKKLNGTDAEDFVSKIIGDRDKKLIDNASLVPESGYLAYAGRSTPVFAGPTIAAVDQAATSVRKQREKQEEATHRDQNFFIDAVFRLSRTRTAFVSGLHYMVWNEDRSAFESDPIAFSDAKAEPVFRVTRNEPITAGFCTHGFFDFETPPDSLKGASVNNCSQFFLASKSKFYFAVDPAKTPAFVVPNLIDKEAKRADKNDRLDSAMILQLADTRLNIGFAGKNLYDLDGLAQASGLTINPFGEHNDLFPESELGCVTAAIQTDRNTVFLFQGNRYTRFRVGMRERITFNAWNNKEGHIAAESEGRRYTSVAHGGALDDQMTLEPEVYRFAAAKWAGLEKFARVNPDNRNSQQCLSLDNRYDGRFADGPFRRVQAGDPPLWALSGYFGAVGPTLLYTQHPLWGAQFDRAKVPNCVALPVHDLTRWRHTRSLEARSTYRSYRCEETPTVDQVMKDPDAFLSDDFKGAFVPAEKIRNDGRQQYDLRSLPIALDFVKLVDLPKAYLGDWSNVKYVTVPIWIEAASQPRDFDLHISTPNGSASCSFDKVVEKIGKKLVRGWNYVTVDLEDNSLWKMGPSNSQNTITDLIKSGPVQAVRVRIGGYAAKSDWTIDGTSEYVFLASPRFNMKVNSGPGR